ncbi:copper resistance CopC/CopD family protein [Streptomyces sp. NBC_00690]|uniref:copper resistance CopC/CopD family protein n=1 Tax=Streptomyces sp. NBC_00690 TaxID=2975808 RepID=UPI002E2C7D94|nr:copper resistance protein CopC [Streptomyces sp. NBC_00690]
MTAIAPLLGALPSGPLHPRTGPGTRRPLHRRVLAATVLLGTVLGLLLFGAAPASAHAALTGSNPQDGAVVATAPSEVKLTFSEQIAMGKDSIRVLEPSGKRADRATVRDLSAGGTVAYGVELLPDLPQGTYTVAWRAVSADSHPISGAFTFSIGAPSSTEVSLSAQEPGTGVVGVLYDIARYAAYTGFVLMVGGASFILLCWQRGAGVRPVQRLIIHGWVTLTAATLAMLLLRSPYTGSGKLADAFELSGLRDVLESKTGAALVSRLLLLGAAALFIAVLFGSYARRDAEPDGTPGDGGDDASGVARKDLTFGLAVGGTVVAAGIAATWALSEHASTGIQPGVAMPVDVIHLLAVATWLGGLAALLTTLYRGPSIEEGAVRKFSQVAFVSVVALAATGLYQSWRQVGSWSALTGTSYGRLLLLKVALVGVMLGVAWLSRRWTQRLGRQTESDDAPDATEETAEETETETAVVGASTAAGGTVAAADPVREAQLARQRSAVASAGRKKARDADPLRSGLRRSVLAEASIAVVLLAVTTVLTTTEPGRTQEEAAKSTGSSAAGAVAQGPAELKIPFDTGGTNGKGTIRLTLDPASPGANALHLWIDDPAGAPLDAPEISVSFTLEDKQIGPLPTTPQRLAAGHWTAPSVQIPMPGDWKVQVTVRTSDFDQVTVDENVKIG